MRDPTPPSPRQAAVIARIARLPPPLQGACWMLAAALLFSVMNIGIREATSRMHPFEVVFFRNLFSLGFLLPWLWQGGIAELRTANLKLYVIRGLIGLTAMLSWFYAVTLIPLASAVALSFTTPLFTTVLAALVLRETVRIRRWTATLVGFGGILVIIRPGIDSIDLGTALMLLSASASAVSLLIVKRLTRTESSTAIVTYLTLVLTPMSFLASVSVWTWPDLPLIGWLVGIGGTGLLAHICLVRAFAVADASLVLIFDYARLPLVALLAYLIYHETTDIWTWVGAAIIALASIYIARREAKLHRARAGASPPRPTDLKLAGQP
ncbi:MAG: DMT family transporter [Alphaproteobacteria bacterium]|nr:DMT family transporter [Alphaproteobacteria bacterium]